jgi:hypothetical protein
MDPTLLNVMTAAVVVAAVAIVIQTVLLFAMYRASRAMKNQVAEIKARTEPLVEKAEALIVRIEPLTDTGRRLLEDSRMYVGELSRRTTELMDLSRTQLVRVDEIMGEATSRTRAQMDRVEMVLDDTVNRFQETTTLLQTGVLRPLKQLNALTIGVRTAIESLLGGRRTTVEQATHDEEMFI